MKFIHFADDTTAFASDDNLSTLYCDVKESLDFVDIWIKLNRLSLNIDKTMNMLLTHNTLPGVLPNIVIRGSQIVMVENVNS